MKTGISFIHLLAKFLFVSSLNYLIIHSLHLYPFDKSRSLRNKFYLSENKLKMEKV